MKDIIIIIINTCSLFCLAVSNTHILCLSRMSFILDNDHLNNKIPFLLAIKLLLSGSEYVNPGSLLNNYNDNDLINNILSYSFN